MPEDNVFINQDVDIYQDASDYYNQKTNPIPVPEKNIGIETQGQFIDKVVDAGLSSKLDIAKIESFTQVSNNRETILQLLDTMAEDSFMAAALELYAEDATEANDAGDIVWCSSDNDKIAKYVTYLIETMNINKNIYKWAYSLCKYGDVYLRLYRNSEYEDKLFDNEKKKVSLKESNNEEKQPLNEEVVLKVYSQNDRYSHYVEMVPNPAEMFELTKFGKSCGYIKANIGTFARNNDNMFTTSYKYSFSRSDVEVFNATDFVHAALEDNTSRIPEEVEIFLDEKNYKSNTNALNYTVRRGQSILYPIFKLWRMMMLLENSLLLNRLTKSSIIRVIGVEVGDMPKENIGPHLMGIKQLLEQKTALDVNNSLSEYTNPGPIENNVYIPTHNGQGALSIQTVNDNPDVNGLADIDYFKNKLYAALKIPKAFLGDTDDPGGFNGGTSLSLQSSRYAKTIKRIQSTLCQMVTDAVNLMLIDKGLDSYVNKFDIKMQAPTTQEEKDKQDAKGTNINMIQDIMNLLDGTEIENASAKLKILKALLSETVSDPEVLKIIQDQIDEMESAEEVGEDTTDDELRALGGIDDNAPGRNMHNASMDINVNDESPSPEQDLGTEEEATLPSPNELDAGDFTDLNNELI